MSSMKMLVVTTSFPLKRGDSLTPFLWEFCLQLKGRGWDITVVVPHHKGVEFEDKWEGIRIKRFKYLPEKMENFAYSGGLLPGLKKNPLRIFGIAFFINSMYRKVLKVLNEENFDIINVHWLFPAAFWARKLSRKKSTRLVFTGHGTDVQLTRKPPFDLFADKVLKAASGLTVNSHYMLEILKERTLPDRVEIIPMGTDIEKFKPGKEKPSNSNKILFIGRLIRQKGVNILLDAFKILKESFPQAELEIIGYGPEKKSLQSKANIDTALAGVSFSDAVDHGNLPAKYQSARVFALPSLIGEGFGMTVAEAAACGIPAVTFGLGGTAELVIDGETGLVTGQNAESLANGFIRVFGDDKLVDELGGKARQRIVDLYSWKIIGDKFDRFFREIAQSE